MRHILQIWRFGRQRSFSFRRFHQIQLKGTRFSSDEEFKSGLSVFFDVKVWEGQASLKQKCVAASKNGEIKENVF